MKVNLLIDGYPLNGFLNIDPLTQPNDSSKIQHNLENLDELIDNNECDEFLANGILDTFPLGARNQVLNHWLSKVEHNGVFVMSGVDINKVSRLIISGDININDANTLLYGKCNHIWTIKKGLWTINDAVDAILQNGQFKILSKSFNGLDYVIKAKRT